MRTDYFHNYSNEYMWMCDTERICRWNVRMRVLDISNIFAQTVSFRDRPRLLAEIFTKTVNEFNDLQELIVRNNSLTSILPDTFCKVSAPICVEWGWNISKTIATNRITVTSNKHRLQSAFSHFLLRTVLCFVVCCVWICEYQSVCLHFSLTLWCVCTSQVISSESSALKATVFKIW